MQQEFIERTSKSVDQVDFATSTAAPEYPQLSVLQGKHDVPTALRLYVEEVRLIFKPSGAEADGIHTVAMC